MCLSYLLCLILVVFVGLFVLVLSCAVLLCLYSSVCSLVVELRCVLHLSLCSFVLCLLCCVVLCCVVLCCAVLYCIALCCLMCFVCFVLCCVVFCSVVLDLLIECCV